MMGYICGMIILFHASSCPTDWSAIDIGISLPVGMALCEYKPRSGERESCAHEARKGSLKK